MKRFQGRCDKCNRIFALDGRNSDMCVPCESAWKDQLKATPNKKCTICESHFYSPNGIRRCPSCSQKLYSTVSKPPLHYDLKNHKSNFRKGNRVSLEEMIRRQEYKRVMDDEGWDHYLKGKKWDKI